MHLHNTLPCSGSWLILAIRFDTINQTVKCCTLPPKRQFTLKPVVYHKEAVVERMQMRPCPGCGAIESRVRFTEQPFIVVECPACSLVFLGNPPAVETLYDDYYSTAEPSSVEYRADSVDSHLRELHAINSQRVARIQQLRQTGSMLDIGCGRGQFLKIAREHGFQIYGIDVSEKAVSYARREFGLKADNRLLEDVAASGEQFDVATLWHVLEHFADPYAALKQVKQLLKSGGMCVIEVPNLHSLKFILSATKWEGGNHPLYHRTFFTADTLRTALVRSGFSSARRVRWSYSIPGRSGSYEWMKQALNVVAMDAFLDFVAWK